MNKNLGVLALFYCFFCLAEETIQVDKQDEIMGAKGTSSSGSGKKNFIIPYPYYSQTTSATAGVVLASRGIFQPQITAFANFIYSTNDSKIAVKVAPIKTCKDAFTVWPSPMLTPT